MKIENYCLLKLFQNFNLEIMTLEPEQLHMATYTRAPWQVDLNDSVEIIPNIYNIPRGKHSGHGDRFFIFIKQDCTSLAFCPLKSPEQKFFYFATADVPMYKLLPTLNHEITKIEKLFCFKALMLLWTNRQTLIALYNNFPRPQPLRWLSPIKYLQHNIIHHEISFIDGLKIIDFDEKNEMIILENQTNLYLRLGTYVEFDKSKMRACIIGRHESVVAYFENTEEVNEIKNPQENKNPTNIL
jgi:hypothetical protein